MQIDGLAQSIPAGASVNLFQGRYPEFIGGANPSVMRLLANADAAGVTCQLTQNAGQTQLAPIAAGATLNVAAAAGQGPKDDEDTIIPAVTVPPNTRQAFIVTNTTAGAIIVRYRAIVGP